VLGSLDIELDISDEDEKLETSEDEDELEDSEEDSEEAALDCSEDADEASVAKAAGSWNARTVKRAAAPKA
jgi:hypothetical protein